MLPKQHAQQQPDNPLTTDGGINKEEDRIKFTVSVSVTWKM